MKNFLSTMWKNFFGTSKVLEPTPVIQVVDAPTPLATPKQKPAKDAVKPQADKKPAPRRRGRKPKSTTAA